MENLGIDGKLLFAQLVNFGIFFFVFQRFISKPFLKFLKEQKETEEMRSKMAQELEERQAVLEAKDKEANKKRKDELDKAIAAAKKEAQVVKQEIMAEAKAEAEDLIKKTRTQMAEERETMYKDMRQQIAQVSMMVVEKALTEYLTGDAQEKVTKNIIKHIPDDAKLAN
ncbi:MAG: hypothetical protein ACEQSA_00930 [Weeksellaceae bacterium]